MSAAIDFTYRVNYKTLLAYRRVWQFEFGYGTAVCVCRLSDIASTNSFGKFPSKNKVFDMKFIRLNPKKDSAVVLFAILFACAFSFSNRAIAQESFELLPGVVIDQQQGTAYVMSPGNKTSAVRIDDGRTIWTTQEIAKPIALKEHRLIGQAEPKNTGVFSVVMVDVKREGQLIKTNDINLPSHVFASIDQSPDRHFEISTGIKSGQLDLFWQYDKSTAQGIAPTEDTTPETDEKRQMAPRNAAEANQGGFRIDMSTGRNSPLAQSQVRQFNLQEDQETKTVQLGEKISKLKGFRSFSADDKHVLISEKIGNDLLLNRYRWRVYEIESGRLLGEVMSHAAAARFYVSGSTIIHEAMPMTVRTAEDKLEELPLRLVGASLKSGKELWSKPVRDTTYRGPLPH